MGKGHPKRLGRQRGCIARKRRMDFYTYIIVISSIINISFCIQLIHIRIVKSDRQIFIANPRLSRIKLLQSNSVRLV